MPGVILPGPCQTQTTDGPSTGQSSSTEKNITKPKSTGKIICFSQKTLSFIDWASLQGESSELYIFLGLASIPVVFTLIGLAHMIWKNCDLRCKCCALCKDLEKQDVNDIYGTYARGWDGEGEYGVAIW